MGANFSSQKAKLIQDLRNITDQTCAAGASTQQYIGTPNYIIDNCQRFRYHVENNSNIAVNCSMESYASAMVKAVQEMTAAQKAGLGFNVSGTDQEIKQQILNKLDQLCSPRAISSQIIGVDPTVIDMGTRIGCKTSADCMYPNNGELVARNYGSCGADKVCTGAPYPPSTVKCIDSDDADFSYLNTGNASSNCVMLAVQNATADANQISRVEQSGINIVLLIGLIVGGLIVVGVLAYVIKRSMRKDAMAAR